MPKIFLNGTVGSEITAKRVKDFLASEKDNDITVIINSVGGSVSEGVEIYNLLKYSGRRITTCISGMAASMGSIIFLAGEERIAMDGSLFMIHRPQSMAAGNADDFRMAADLLDKNQLNINKIYEERTTISNLDEAINRTTWFTVDEMKDSGITNSERKLILFDPDDSIEQTYNRTEGFITMGKKEDLKAELDAIKAENEKLLAEKKEAEEEAELAKQLEEAKAENVKLTGENSDDDTDTSENNDVDGPSENDVDDPHASASVKDLKVSVELDAKDTNILQEMKAEIKSLKAQIAKPNDASIKKEIIDTKNTVVEQAMKTSKDIPAFMQAESKY